MLKFFMNLFHFSFESVLNGERMSATNARTFGSTFMNIHHNFDHY